MMKLWKKQALTMIAVGALIGFSSCCKDDDTATFYGEAIGLVDGFDSYGNLVPSFTHEDLMNKGFEYSDLLEVTINDSIVVQNVPFVTGFNEVGIWETCFCDYNKLNTKYYFALIFGNFKERIGGQEGQKIVVKLEKRHGYMDTWKVMQSVYDYDRKLYPEETDEEFANFREVTTTGMAKGVLYRSSNPLNPKNNAVRFAYADSLARHYGIKTEIDLADTKAKYIENSTRDDFTSTYCPELVKEGNVIMLGLTTDTYSETFISMLGDGLRFMLNHEPPFLLHCNEGKDCCGFVSMLFEALAGATYEEIADDYMKTLTNFYRIEKGSDSYNLRQKKSIDRLVWLLENVKKLPDYDNIDWSDKDPRNVQLQSAAEKYVQDCGLSEEQCQQLKRLLQTGKKD